MSKNNTSVSVSTETPESSDVRVKRVLDALSGDARIERGTDGFVGSFGSRTSSGFDTLSTGERARVRNGWDARIKTMVRNGQFALVSTAMDLADTLRGSSRSSVSSEVTEESVRSRVGEMVAMLRFAADALFAGSVPIEGFDGIVPILDESDIPDLTDEQAETALNRYASVRFGTKTKENDIPDMLRNVLGTYETGTFRRISQIRNDLAEMYPNKGISSEWDGRLNAALFGSNWDDTHYTPIPSNKGIRHDYDEKGRAGVYVASHPESDETDSSAE